MIVGMTDYETTLMHWRENYQKDLLAEYGWLSTIALSWLAEADNLIGSSERSLVSLDKARFPDCFGRLRLEQGKVQFEAEAGFSLSYQGQAIQRLTLELADNQNSDHLYFEGLALSIIRRGSDYGLRVFDREAIARKRFKGLNWFPINPEYAVEAEFVTYDSPRPISITNILGGSHQTVIPGEVRFLLNGQSFSLLPVRNKQGLFFVFKDLSSQDLTYPPGRFLSVEMPSSSKLILDFNKAQNPPCAFTPYATCPLPFQENHLPVSILAGEKRYRAD